ncbi:MAG TPA: alpha/beta hydrolase [Pseudonocardiaceae bacterium]|jgi:pimeloyl-ACP methyl ester carboxylesterase
MSTTDEQSFTTPDGTRLALYWQGRRDAPVTIVLVHGWTLDSRTWGPVADALSTGPRARPVLRYDLRGHGRSDPAQPDTETIAQAADDLADLLGAAVTGPVVLVGHSMGGMAVMALAQRHPELLAERVVGVAFVATSCGDMVPHNLGLRPQLARMVARGETALRRWALASGWWLRREPITRWTGLIRPGVRWLLFGAHPRPADVMLCATCLAQGRAANLVTFRATLDEHDQVAALAAFRQIPGLVVGAMSDRLTPIRHTDKIAAELPHATLVRYAGAGHLVTLERAEQVADRIDKLICSVESGQQLPAK